MKSIAMTRAIASLLLAAAFAFAQDNTLTPEEKKDGWKLLLRR